MENSVDFKALGFNPGDKVVRVKKPSGKFDYYSVTYPAGYIARCEKDGKVAEFLGTLNAEYKLR